MAGWYEKVDSQVCRIPCGKVATYGQIARRCGNPRMSRQVGWALHVNPRPGVIPCHRVVNRNGMLTGAFAFGGMSVQRDLLVSEGVEVQTDRVDLDVYLWDEK